MMSLPAQPVGAVAAIERINSGSAVEHIVSASTVHRVGTPEAQQQLRATVTVESLGGVRAGFQRQILSTELQCLNANQSIGTI